MKLPRSSRHGNGVRTERSDPDLVARVLAERKRLADEASDAALERERVANALFDATAHVRIDDA